MNGTESHKITRYTDDIFCNFENLNNMGISVEFYHMHNLEIRQKDRITKVFIFKDKKERDFFWAKNFGWWSDSETIWTNIKSEYKLCLGGCCDNGEGKCMFCERSL